MTISFDRWPTARLIEHAGTVAEITDALTDRLYLYAPIVAAVRRLDELDACTPQGACVFCGAQRVSRRHIIDGVSHKAEKEPHGDECAWLAARNLRREP